VLLLLLCCVVLRKNNNAGGSMIGNSAEGMVSFFRFTGLWMNWYERFSLARLLMVMEMAGNGLLVLL